MNTLLLKTTLLLTGISIIILGADSAIGGLETLGIQVRPDYFTITDSVNYLTRDNHIRFLGGAWIGVGILYVAGAFFPSRLCDPILITIGFVVLGGISRITSPDITIVLQTTILGSLLAELIFFPALGCWLYQNTKSQANKLAS